MPFVPVGERQLHYREVGKGRPVVLLHAFPVTGAMFSPQLEAPPKGVRLIVPDARGFGGSTPGEGPTTMDQVAQDVLALLDALEVRRAVVGGVSMGGYQAMALTRLDPGRVEGLVLIDTQASADDDAAKAKREETAKAVEEKGIEVLVETMVPKLLAPEASDEVRRRVEAMIRGVPPKAAAAMVRGLGLRADSKDILARFGGPALVVVGEKDGITPPEKAKAMAGLLSRATLVTVPKAGHLSSLENPEAFNAAFAEFLATLPG